jgi:hypothetical protein
VTSKTVSIPITQDALSEGDETLSLSLSIPSAGSVLGTQKTAWLTIKDDEKMPAFFFSTVSYSVGEGAGSATITINRSGSTTSAGSVDFATANGSATAGSDYTAVSQTVSFAAGVTSKTVSVAITDDSSVESDETVQLSLSSPSSGASLGSPHAATLTIIDNDTAPGDGSGSASGKISSAHLTKKSFKRSQVAKVKLLYSFSPKSEHFSYLLSLKKKAKWLTVQSVAKAGSFEGSYTMTVKKLFGGKAIKAGSYRLKLSADKNSKLLTFRVT